jgi:predicted transcriptional regulator
MKLLLMKKRYIFNKVPGLPITRLDSDILLALAKEGPLNRYQLASKLRKPYTSIRGSIRRLLRLRLVEISSEEKAPTGLPKPILSVNDRRTSLRI